MYIYVLIFTDKILKFNTMKEFIHFVSDEQRCIDFVREVRWNGNVTCAYCKHEKVYELKGVNKRFKCAQCKRQFSVIKGTIFENSPIPLSKWLEAIYYLVSRKRGISSPQLSKEIGVTIKTAWFMLGRIRLMLMKNINRAKLSGYVEADETYIGGKNKNRHPDKKAKGAGGRSCKDKAPVVGIISPEEYEYIERPHKTNPARIVRDKIITKPAVLICKATSSVRKEVLQPFIKQNVELGAILVTDEYQAYKGLAGLYEHQVVVHRLNEYVNDQGFTTNRIENAWTHLKATVMGNYRMVSRKHLHRYLDEYCFRFNHRHYDLDKDNLMLRSFENLERRLTWKQLVRKSSA